MIVFGSVKLVAHTSLYQGSAPDVFDPRSREGNLKLILEDRKKQESWKYQDKMRKIRFVWAIILVAGITLAIFCAS